MPNIKSAEKRVSIAERNRLRNISIKSAVRTAVRRVLESVKTDNQETITAKLNAAYSTIDKAVSKGILHKNTAARKKSRLTIFVTKNTKA